MRQMGLKCLPAKSRRSKPLDFQALLNLPPQLRELYEKVLAIREEDRFAQLREDGSPPVCPTRLSLRQLRDEVEELVGWFAPKDTDPRLRTAAAFDLVCDNLLSALPRHRYRRGCRGDSVCKQLTANLNLALGSRGSRVRL